MNNAHQALQQLGVSNQQLDQLVSSALAHGAYGAKLTGGAEAAV